MLEREAREILGVTQNASFSEIKKSYRQLAKVMHPDLVTPEHQSQAAAAMARINEAWAAIEEREKNGALGKVETQSEPNFAHGRRPNSSECFMCGYSPATYFKAPSVVSFLVWGNYRGFEGVACRNCGTTMSRLAALDSLRKGWWGLGILWMPYVIISWIRNELKFRKLSFPLARASDVVSLLSAPSPLARSPLKDPFSLVASVLAIFIVFSVISAPGTGINSSSGVDPTTFGMQGTCYTLNQAKQTVGLADCTNPLAVKISLGEAKSQSNCPSGTSETVNIKLKNGSDGVTCLGPWGGVEPSRICYSLEENKAAVFDCSTYPDFNFTVCGSNKYANLVAIDSAGNVLYQLRPSNGGVWIGIQDSRCTNSQYAFSFTTSEPRRVGIYKLRLNLLNSADPKDILQKSGTSNIIVETVS